MHGKIRGKYPSIRLLVMSRLGIALAVFMLVFSYLFITNMLKMVRQNADEQIRARSGTVTSAIEESMASVRALSNDWASWDDSYEFALGNNPEHFSRYWAEDWKIKGHQLNFLYVKDLSGNDLYFKCYDYFNEENIQPPEGFSDFLNGLGEYMLQSYSEQKKGGAEHPTGKDGIVFYNGIPYYICARPILTYDEKSDPSGSLFFGRIFSEQELERISGANDLYFTVIDGASAPEYVPDSGGTIARTNDRISFSEPLKGFYDRQPVTLKIESARGLYKSSINVIVLSCLMLVTVMLILVFVIFWLLQTHVLRHIEKISGDVQSVTEASEPIDIGKYGGSKEFFTLASSINGMLASLNESKESVMRSMFSKQMLENVLNGLNIYLLVNDPNTCKILFMNDKMKEHFQINGDVIGKHSYDVLSHCGNPEAGSCPRRKLLENPGETLEHEIRHKSNGRYYTQFDLLIDWVDAKKVHLLYLIDITGTKQAEASLKKRFEQEELMSAISSAFITDNDIKAFMNNALEMTGKFMNVNRINMARCIGDEDGKAFELQYVWDRDGEPDGILVGGKVEFRENTPMYEALVTNNAGYFSVNDASAGVLYNHVPELAVKSFMMVSIYVSGEFWGVLEFERRGKAYSWTDSDIHLAELIANLLSGVFSRQKVERRLRSMEALINSASQTAITYVQPGGGFSFFNPAACEISGYSPDELSAGGVYMLYDKETQLHLRDEIIPKIFENGKYEFEVPVIRKDGNIRIMNYLGFEIEKGTLDRGYIGTDVTEKRELEKELVEAKEAAEQASRAKSDFLSRMSHEIRTPINAIIGMSNIAHGTHDQVKKEYCLDKIDDASKHLLGVINDVLDMSKIESGKFELFYAEFEFEKMLMQTVDVVNFRIDEKNQTLIVNLDKSVPPFIIGDEHRLRQILSNLLTNAVKFTHDGGTIILSVECVDVTDGVCAIQMVVTDNGIGISPEQSARLFRPFEQADGGTARKYGGTGLGLVITKHIVEMMGGGIRVESELGKGSEFIFTIKAEKGREAARSFDAKGVNKDNVHILAVDDSSEIRSYFLHIMEALDLPCDVAENGYQAVEMIKNRKEKAYNIFFVDWKMPEMNGIELTKKIKEVAGANAVVIMISVAEWSDIEKDALAAGVSRFIPKPIFPSVLMDTINECMGAGPGNRVEALAPVGKHLFENHVILMAEDIDVNREIVQELLSGTGLTVESAENGAQAVEMFENSPGKYSLILMDVQMPEMDGYEASRRIRSSKLPQAVDIPIVAMTANVFREDIENCLSAGMNDHIGKPIDTGDLFDKLQKYLRTKAATPVAANPGGCAAEADCAARPPVIDAEEGLRRLMNNEKLYFSLLSRFDGRRMADELIGNIKDADFPNIIKNAHTLKGVAANLALIELKNLVSDIEASAKAETECADMAAALDEAVNAVDLSIRTLLQGEESK